jgi:hypothetical protein
MPNRLRLDEPTTPERFAGLELQAVQEVEIQQVGPCVWVFLKRQDGSLLRVWIGPPARQSRSTDVADQSRITENRRGTQPLRVTVETDTL